MRSAIAQTGEPAVRSELARFCLPSTRRETGLWLAWVNSVCLVFLVVGVMGVRTPLPRERAREPVEASNIPVVELPLTAPTPRVMRRAEESVAPVVEAVAMPTPVVVTWEQPSVVFAVPEVGEILATVPPLKSVSSPSFIPLPAPVDLARDLGTRYFPAPQWTPRLMQARMSGTVVLLITVDNNGGVQEIRIRQSTGHRALDEHTVNHVKRYFVFPTGRGVLTYELPVEWDNPLTRR